MDFVEIDGTVPIEEWLAGLGPGTRGAINQQLLTMEGMTVWNYRWIKKYKTTELFELRFAWARLEYRPLGMYRPGRQFVLLEGAIEKGGKIHRGHIDRADGRRQILVKEPHHVRRHRFGPS